MDIDPIASVLAARTASTQNTIQLAVLASIVDLIFGYRYNGFSKLPGKPGFIFSFGIRL